MLSADLGPLVGLAHGDLNAANIMIDALERLGGGSVMPGRDSSRKTAISETFKDSFLRM